MNEIHRKHLTAYLNDMVAVERDISQAVRGQLEDERVDRHEGLRDILLDIVAGSEGRTDFLRKISQGGGGALGAAVKGTVMAVAGTLAGIYGKLREHPVSRMVRDDIIALDVAVTGYGMLLTMARCLDQKECTAFAQLALLGCPPLVSRLDHVLPLVIAHELAEDGPIPVPDGVELAQDAIRQVWQQLPPP
ncbi:hypothetical protein OKA05_10970 [Luteolibacter arcticus]|uniref:DUF892 family protein n=1 Tax=Luteolibacter arcticus TaxID=1581411 RepID=A0ABT3GHU2_9BACT|nr:hypothetical protein [Luteolibacter arcticus]MCW1923075.1 hypothetical protein [Luteolibacter arcticus]